MLVIYTNPKHMLHSEAEKHLVSVRSMSSTISLQIPRHHHSKTSLADGGCFRHTNNLRKNSEFHASSQHNFSSFLNCLLVQYETKTKLKDIH